MFFAISGYIVFDSSIRAKCAIQFILHRIYRILPLYVITTILFCLTPMNITHNIRYILKAFIFLPQSSENIPLLFNSSLANKRFFLPSGWTLNYEMFFYIVIAISRFFQPYRFVFINIIFLFLIIICPYMIGNGVFIHCDSILAPDDMLYNITYFNLITNPINIYFLIGVLASYLQGAKDYININHTTATYLYGASFMLLLISIYISYNNPNLYYSGVSIILTAPFCIMAFIYGDTLNLYNRFLVICGDVSFSIYLVHTLVIIALFEIGIRVPIVLSIIVILVTHIISLITHKYIEVKLYNYLKNRTDVYFNKQFANVDKNTNSRFV